MKKIAFFLAAMCCAVSLYATDCERGGSCGYDENNSIAWTYNEGVLSFYGSGVMASYDAQNPAPWDCWKDEVTAVVFEHNVSFIAEYAFYGFSHLATVQFPTGEFTIGKYAFGNCSALTEVVIPADVKYIRKNAFNGSALTTVYLLGAEPFEFLDYGGYDVPFNGCASLAKIYVPAGSLNAYQTYWGANQDNEGYVQYFAEGAPTWATVGEEVVDGDFTYTVVNVADRTMSVKRTSGLETRFKDKVVYKGMVWNVKELAANAFANATFDRYDIPSYITKIGDGAFSGCANLYIVEASATTPAILGANVFDGLPAGYTINVVSELENAYKAAWSAYAEHINKGVAPYAADVEIDGLTYYLRGYDVKTAQITGIAGAPTEITIPATVEYEGYTYTVNSIEPNAFVGNTSVEKLTLAVDLHKEDMSEGIGFSVTPPSKEDLDALLAASSITQEQYNAILYCTGQATSVFSPDNTTLKEVVIADGVTRIPAALFGGLQGIEKVTIPASITAIEEDAFLNCTGITSVISRATSPISLADFYRVFPMKNDTRILYVSYAARQAYRDAIWNRFFFFDEDAVTENQNNVNVASLESEMTSDADLQATLEAMVQTAAEAEADPDVSIVTTNLTIQRKLYKDGYLNTICLPFALATLDGTPLEGGEIFAFDHANVENGEMSMVVYPIDHMEAGIPYFIRWENTGEILEEMEFKNIVITQTVGLSVQGATGNVEFKGHLGLTHVDVEEELNNTQYSNLYLAANDTFKWPAANDATSMKGFRAYFRVKLGSNNSNNAPRRGMPVRIVYGENAATGIENAMLQEGTFKTVENGQLVIIREGVRYNAAGQVIQ